MKLFELLSQPVCPFGFRVKSSSGHAVALEEQESRTDSVLIPHNVRISAQPYGVRLSRDALRERGRASSVNKCALFSGETTNHPLCNRQVIAFLVDPELFPLVALPQHSVLGAHSWPNRDSPRSIIAWPLRYEPFGVALAAYLIMSSSNDFCTGTNPHR